VKAMIAASMLAIALLVAPGVVLAGTHQLSLSPATALRLALTPGAGFPSLRGAAEFQTQGTQSEFQIEIEHATALAGQTLQVQVNGTTAGTMTISKRGTGQLTLASEHGQTVPAIAAGSTVTVLTGTSAIVATGTF